MRSMMTCCSIPICLVAAFGAIVVVVTALFVDRLSAKREQAETLAARLRVEKEASEGLLREVGRLATRLPSELVATGDQFRIVMVYGQVNKAISYNQIIE
jgi:hypothetical protein